MRQENGQRWQRKLHSQIQTQLKLSAILKEELRDVAQGYGFLIDKHGKYCALAAVVKYLGYDLAPSQEMNKDSGSIPQALIPSHITERIEAFPTFYNSADYPACSCRKPNYYNYTMMSLLIHLNDFHHMTFEEIGDWLETRGM